MVVLGNLFDSFFIPRIWEAYVEPPTSTFVNLRYSDGDVCGDEGRITNVRSYVLFYLDDDCLQL